MALSKTPQQVIQGSPVDPLHRPVPAEMTTLLTEMRSEYQEFGTALSYASILRPTWTALASLAPDGIGQQAEVSPDDSGTHTDPQTSATVDNAGRYTAFGTSAGQWTWVDGGGLASKLSISARLSEFSGPFAPEVRTNIGAASQADMDAAEAAIADKADADAVATALSEKADADSVVTRTGDQTISDVKTFTSAPVVPDGSFSIATTSGLQSALDAKGDQVTVTGAVERSRQLFDKSTAVLDFRLDPTNGTLIALAGAWTSQPIPVTAGLQYSFTYPYYVVWYDASGAYISGTATASSVETAPPGAVEMRLTGRTNLGHNIEDQMVAQSSAVLPYEPYGGLLQSERLSGDWNIRDASPFTRRTVNLFDPGDPEVEIGRYQTKNGTINNSATYTLSGYISVTEGQTYSFGSGERSARFLCAFDASRAAVEAAGSDSTVTTWTCPAGVNEIRISTWAAAAAAGVVQVYEGATMPPLEPWGYNLGDTYLPWLPPLEAVEGMARMRHCTMFRSQREAGVASRLSVVAIGDSYTDAASRWVNKTMDRLVAAYGDGGGGWTGYAFGGSATYVIGGSQPSGAHGNARPASYDLDFSGAWAGTFVGSYGPDLGFVQSSTAGAYIRRTVPAAPDHTHLALVWIDTADGVIRHRVDGGAWTTVNTQGTVGNINSANITLTAGAHTIEIEVVSGTVQLCGDIAVSVADGVVLHKLGISGGRIDQFADANAAQHLAALTLLAPDVAIIMEGTNSQGNGASGNYSSWTTDITTVINRVRAAGANPDVLLVAPPENMLGRVNPMADFSMQMRFLARTKDAAFLALQESFGAETADYASDGPFPLFSSDGVHPLPSTGGYIMDLAVRRAMGLS